MVFEAYCETWRVIELKEKKTSKSHSDHLDTTSVSSRKMPPKPRLLCSCIRCRGKLVSKSTFFGHKKKMKDPDYALAPPLRSFQRKGRRRAANTISEDVEDPTPNTSGSGPSGDVRPSPAARSDRIVRVVCCNLIYVPELTDSCA